MPFKDYVEDTPPNHRLKLAGLELTSSLSDLRRSRDILREVFDSYTMTSLGESDGFVKLSVFVCFVEGDQLKVIAETFKRDINTIRHWVRQIYRTLWVVESRLIGGANVKTQPGNLRSGDSKVYSISA